MSDGREARDLDAFVEARSVSQLIASRLDPVDPWRLALVQRHHVWDEVRISHLLDSLIAGYPIGSLLVCRVRQPAHVLVERDGTRKAEEARSGTWQLLDGQQRVNALVSIFSEHGRFGRFYLNMLRPRVPEDVITRRRDRRRALDYIVWRSDDVGAAEPPEPRQNFVDLSRVHAWAADRSQDDILAIAERLRSEPTAVLAFLNDIDPAFADELSDAEHVAVAARTRALLRVWAEPAIPVQHFTVESPSDVLQVFARINLAGVRLDGEDVFFAAVKTEWPDAEEHLDRVAAASPLLNRVTALRLLARLASRAQSRDDLLPLRVDRLNGPKGRLLVRTMERLAADDSPVLGRIGVLGRLLTTESEVGYGLRLVNDGLLDHVFGWAAVNAEAEDEAAIRREVPSIEAYLLGAHGFRYPTIFNDGFLRLGFAEAVAAGSIGDPFPTERIIAGARRRWPGLRRGQRFVADIGDDDALRHFLDQNAGLFLSVVQRIPYSMPDREPVELTLGKRQVEWDHVYPQARADRMRVPKGVGGRPIHHEDRRLVWNGGNLWALDRPINNFASASLPSAKFDLLRRLPDRDRRLPSVWPAVDDHAIAPAERADLLEAERLLAAKDVEGAMPLFRRYAVTRALRLYHTVIDRYPTIEAFAASALIDEEAFEDASAESLRSALALDDDLDLVDEPVPPARAVAVDDERFTSVLARADQAGVGTEVRAIVATGLELGLVPRPRQNSVMFAPRANLTRMLFTIWPQAGRGGLVSIYRWASAITEFFPDIEEAAARSALGEDGYGLLERDDVPGFLQALRELFAGRDQSDDAGGAQLTGSQIRQLALDWLRVTDPDRQGVHYYEIANAVRAHGRVGRIDPMPAMLKVLIRYDDDFAPVGPGTYTWVEHVPREPGAPRPTRYWAMRTDQNRRADLWAEIRAGRLRQGWGWDPDMDLQVIAEAVDAGRPLTDWEQQAWGNRRMLTSRDDAIHVGDVVLVPHMPEHRRFSLVRVTGEYEFDGGQVFGDYGHILPVQLLTDYQGIAYTDDVVPVKLQTSLGNRVRLWNLDAFGSELEGLIGAGAAM
jgi:hypothetical protein